MADEPTREAIDRRPRRASGRREEGTFLTVRSPYDDVAAGYVPYRRPDPRIMAAIVDALGSCASVVNVGAGAGSYEPSDRCVIAVEPSAGMIRQRADGAAPVVRAEAAHLPFADGSFDAAMAVLTIHHWSERARGLAELARVARRRVVIVTHDPDAPPFWLGEYVPELFAIDRDIFPTLDELRLSPRVAVRPLPIPHDCTDGFLGAYWRRPHAYLDAGVRAAISTFSRIPAVEDGLERLRTDLANGTWERRHAGLAGETERDLGYRLVVVDLEAS
jgi:SAM-dependent methyltransferase